MDQQQTQNIKQATEQWTDSARQSFKLLADRTVSLQESNLRLFQSFFQNWIEQVHNQAQGTHEATQDLQEQSQRRREAVETLSQEATNTYSEFLDSALSFYQELLHTASQAAQNNMQYASQATQQSVQAASQAGQGGVKETRRATFTEQEEESMADISPFFDKDYEQKEFKELVDAPVDAIQGVSKNDAEALKQAFNIKTVGDLAENKFVRIAQAVV